MAYPRLLASIRTLSIAACVLLGSGPARDADLLPDIPLFMATAHALAIIGESRLPPDQPQPPREINTKSVVRWYENAVAEEQARNARTLERIELRFPERWPGERAEPHSAYRRAIKQEQLRTERALQEIEREYEQRLK